MPERESRRGFIDRREKPASAKLLTPDEIIARSEWGVHTQTSFTFQRKKIYDFVENNVLGIKSNGVDVLSINFRHGNPNLDPLTKAYLSSPRTQLVIAEYFKPDLDRSGIYSGKLARTVHYSPRLKATAQLDKTFQDTGKPIAVVDIANKPSYEIAYLLNRLAPSVETFAALPFIDQRTLLALPLAALIAYSTCIDLQELFQRGVFNRKKVTKYERLVIDLEQARRLFVAKGIHQITRDMPEEAKADSQIVALYPKAHGIRVADILTRPKPFADTARSALYKTIAPFLDYSVRTYEHKSGEEKGLEEGQWQLISNKKIPVRFF